MRRASFTLDEKSDEALDRVAHFLLISRSEVVRRLAATADAAVFWGVQGYVGTVTDREELKRRAERGCEEWGLFALGGRFAERCSALRAGAIDALPPALRVIRGGAADDDEAAALVLDPADEGGAS